MRLDLDSDFVESHQTQVTFTPGFGSELQTLQFSLNLNIRCERFLRAEEEFWVWINLKHGFVGAFGAFELV